MNAAILPSPRPLRLAPPVTKAFASASQRVIYMFIIVQFLSQGLLVVESLGSLRSYLRIAGFGSSLVMFFFLTRFPVYRSYPVRSLGIAFCAILVIGVFHPNANTVSAGTCQLIINLAIFAPIFWSSRVAGSTNFMRNVMLMFWIYSLAGSIVGVLQVYNPDRFAPSPEFVRKLIGTSADGLQITLADGTQVWRPMGLSDSPGGASIAGSFAVIFGIGITLTEKNLLLRLLAVFGAGAGMFCVYICQVRSIFLITLIGVVVYLVIMTIRERLPRLAFLAFAIPAVVVGGYAWAIAVGGVDVTSRLDTLSEQRATDVYYKNRGVFVEKTFYEIMPEYPMGAGLGRWGSSLTLFGDPGLPNSEPIWVEVQITAWVVDGGIPLFIVGYLAVILTCWTSAKLAIKAVDPSIADMAATVCSLNLSLVIMTFNYPVFISQMGITFFLLNAMLYSSAGGRPRKPAVAASYA